jgi:hypothetical protein
LVLARIVIFRGLARCCSCGHRPPEESHRHISVILHAGVRDLRPPAAPDVAPRSTEHGHFGDRPERRRSDLHVPLASRSTTTRVLSRALTDASAPRPSVTNAPAGTVSSGCSTNSRSNEFAPPSSDSIRNPSIAQNPRSPSAWSRPSAAPVHNSETQANDGGSRLRPLPPPVGADEPPTSA